MMKKFTTLSLITFAQTAFSQSGELGTKASSSSGGTATTANSAMPVLQVLVVAAILIFILKFAIPKLVGKAGKRLGTGLNSPIQIEESASFGAGNLYVVSVRGKTLLLGVAGSGVTCLADLSQNQATQTNPEPAFFDILDQATEKSEVTAVVEMRVEEPTQTRKTHAKIDAYKVAQAEVEEETEPRDLQERLERLRRLVG